MGLLISVLLGLFIGVTTSWVFLKWQLRVQPEINVSNIAIWNSKKGTFRIKVVNHGRRQVTDIKADFQIIRSTSMGSYYKRVKLNDLSSAYFIGLKPHNVRNPKDRWGMLWSCALETKSDNDALSILQQPTIEDEEVRLFVYLQCVDAQSGTKLVTTQSYSIENIVIDGKFGYGLGIATDTN